MVDGDSEAHATFSDGELEQTLRERGGSERGGDEGCRPDRYRRRVGGQGPAAGGEPEEEIGRVVPLIERVAGELGALCLGHTYKPAVARAGPLPRGIDESTTSAGGPGLARRVCATGAALVLTHTQPGPKTDCSTPPSMAG